MIEDVEFIRYSNPGSHEVSKAREMSRSFMSRLGSLSERTIKTPGCLPPVACTKKVQIFEIIMVLRQEDQALLDGVHRVTGVGCAAKSRVGRHHNLVADSLQ